LQDLVILEPGKQFSFFSFFYNSITNNRGGQCEYENESITGSFDVYLLLFALRAVLSKRLSGGPYSRRHISVMFSFIPMFLDKQQKHGKEWEGKIGELKNFLLSEMKKLQPKPLLLLIDALDECNELEVRQVVLFLELLSINAISAKIPLNICLSSRHYPNIGMEKTLELIVEEQWEHDQNIVKYV
jgi:hypothetical protein